MGKSYFGETEEQRGAVPNLTGGLLAIKEIERTKVAKETSKLKGARMYVVTFSVVEPKSCKGLEVRDWIIVGTVDDLPAKRPETWNRSEGGPGRLKRLLTRSGTPLSDDDEEWMDAAEGREVVAPVIDNGPDFEGPRNKVGLYYRPSDDDCPEIGIADDQAPRGGKAKAGAKGAAAGARKLRGVAKKVEDEDDDEATKDVPPGEEEDEEEKDEEPTVGKHGKGNAKIAAKSRDDDDEDDD
jgi:hypothetical protein